jgi:hypothetical protein
MMRLSWLVLLLLSATILAVPFEKQTLPVQLVSSIAIADIDNDGALELLAATPENLTLLQFDGQNWAILWSSEASQTPDASAAVYLLDLNQDGLKDMIALDHATSDDQDSNTQHGVWLQRPGWHFEFVDPAWQGENPSPSAALAWREVNGAYELLFAPQFDAPHQAFRTTPQGLVANTPDWLPQTRSHLTGTSWNDLDNDGDLDLSIFDYQGVPLTLQNFNLPHTTSIVNVPAGFGEALSFAHSGTWVDANGDNLLDLWVPTYRGKPDVFFWNNGAFQFTPATGLPITQSNTWSAGSSWLDTDNDGDADLVRVDNFNGIQLFENDGSGQFTQMPQAALGDLGTARGFGGAISKADLNRDGLMDLIIASQSGALEVFFNRNVEQRSYLSMSLKSAQQTPGYGAKVVLEYDQNGESRSRVQSLSGGNNSLGGQDQPFLHFGLGEASWINRLTVNWPDGTQEVYNRLAVNQQIILEQGKAAEQTQLVYPWISNNQGAFESTLYAANLTPVDKRVLLTATRPNGETESVLRSIPANGFLEENAASLFSTLGSGPGYQVTLYSVANGVVGRWVTFNRTSDSGASPSQGVAINLETAAFDQAQIGRRLVFSYLPVSDGFISSPTLVNLGERDTSVALSFFTETETLGGYFIENLSPGVPFAQVTTSLTTTTADYVMCVAESNLADIAGVGFVFNSVFGEAAISNANIDAGAEVLGGDLVFPWVNNNAGNFESTLVLNNTSDANINATLTARRFDGAQEQISLNIPATSVLARKASTLFPQLGSGPGYSVQVQQENSDTPLQGSWVTNTLTAPSGASPSMGSAVHTTQSGGHPRIGERMFLGFLPADEGGFSAAVVVNVGNVAVPVTLSFYNEAGVLLSQQQIESLEPMRPWAQTTQAILGDNNQNVYAIAEASGQPLTGVTFVFNQRGEPAIGNAQAIP